MNLDLHDVVGESDDDADYCLADKVFTYTDGFGTVVGHVPERDAVVVEPARPAAERRKVLPHDAVESISDDEWPWGTTDAVTGTGYC